MEEKNEFFADYAKGDEDVLMDELNELEALAAAEDMAAIPDAGMGFVAPVPGAQIP